MTTAHPFAIVGAIDKSDQARLVLARVGSEAAQHDEALLHVLRVIDVKKKLAERVSLDDEIALLLADVSDVLGSFDAAAHDWRMLLHLRIGHPAEEILALAHEARAHVIAMGHHGETGRRRWAGNTVEEVLQLAPCTVLVAQDQLYDETPELEQCNECVIVRRDSGGERWFCDLHKGDERPLHTVLPFGSTILHSVGFGSGGVF